MATPAVLTFINTFELLEQVLLALSVVDLTRAPRVCHAFRAVIDNSQRLQRHMYLKPETRYRYIEWIKHRWTYCADSWLGWEPHLAQSHAHGALPIVTLHPALLPRRARSDITAWARIFVQSCERTLTRTEFDGNAMLTWRRGGWERMFATQPPVKEVMLRVRDSRRLFADVYLKIDQERGVQLGDVRGALWKCAVWLAEREGPVDVLQIEGAALNPGYDGVSLVPPYLATVTASFPGTLSARSEWVAQAERRLLGPESWRTSLSSSTVL